MIYHIKGTIVATNNQLIIVQPHGAGIGFGIFVPSQEPYSIGSEIALFTYMHWNQESGPLLYGFKEELERKLFLLIISCSGIGPKIALATLEAMNPALFIEAIAQENIQALSKIPGIGKKKAEQIIVYLKHKIEDLIQNDTQLQQTGSIQHWQQITEVLTSLNYSRQETNQAIHYLKQNDLPDASFDMLLRKALSFLTKLK